MQNVAVDSSALTIRSIGDFPSGSTSLRGLFKASEYRFRLWGLVLGRLEEAPENDIIIWNWIGSHCDYDRLLRRI